MKETKSFGSINSFYDAGIETLRGMAGVTDSSLIYNSEIFITLNIEWVFTSILIILSVITFGLIAIEGSFLFRLMCYEVVYLLINIIFICCGFLFSDAISYLFVLMLLTVVAAESAIILALVVLHYNLGGNLKL